MLRKPKREVALPVTVQDASALRLHLQSVVLSGEYGADAVQFYHDSIGSYERGEDFRQALRAATDSQDRTEPSDRHGLSDSAIEFILAHRPTGKATDLEHRLKFTASQPSIALRGPSTIAEWEQSYRAETRPTWQWSGGITPWGIHLGEFDHENRRKDGKERITGIMARLALELNHAELAHLFAETLSTPEQRVSLYFDAYHSSNQAGERVLGTYSDLPTQLEMSADWLTRFKVRQIAETPTVGDPLHIADEVAVLAHDSRIFPSKYIPCPLLFETGVALARAGLPTEGRAFVERNLHTIEQYYLNDYSFEYSFTPDFLAYYDFQAKVVAVTREGLSAKEYRTFTKQVQRRPSPEAIILLALDGSTQFTKNGKPVNDPETLLDALHELTVYRRNDKELGSTLAFHQYLLDTIDTYFPTARLSKESKSEDWIRGLAASGKHQEATDRYLRVRSNDRIQSVRKLAAAAAMASWYNSRGEIATTGFSIEAKIDLLESELRIIIKPGDFAEASAMWQRYNQMIQEIGSEIASLSDKRRKEVLTQRLQEAQVRLNSL